MSAFSGYLALGILDPVTGAFTETAYAGYARQPIAFDLDLPVNGGAVQTGGDVLRNTNAATFTAPAALNWPSVNAFAVFSALTGGVMQIAAPLGGSGGINPRGVARLFRAGFFVLSVQSNTLSSSLGGRVLTIGEPNIIGGALVFSTGADGGSGGLTASQVDDKIAAALAAQGAGSGVSAAQSIVNALLFG